MQPSHSRVSTWATAALAAVIGFQNAAADVPADPLGWPAAGMESKPWTRWWWLGSAVGKANLTRELEDFARAGIGGVEICPIYGARGAEDRYLPFLSPGWVEMLAHVTREAERLGLGVDLTTGTGWPFGGPMVEASHASQGLERVRAATRGGAMVAVAIPAGDIRCLLAIPAAGEPVDLTDRAAAGRSFEWSPPDDGEWRIEGIVTRSGIQQVKRAAPGGEGFVLDPFSADSMKAYLGVFDAALRGFDAPLPRAQFHDSFEYYGADWTPQLFEAFREARGYDLRGQLVAFNGHGDPETVTRVRADYRLTLGELHESYLAAWHDWTAARGGVTRNQAHGSPGNVLDHYAVSEIPETEIFGKVTDDQWPMMRLAASAAHARGNRFVSCETFTWLDEHFQVTPEQLKQAADFVFLAGVNHVFFHGIPYSPDDAAWPGWLFYASTHMGRHGGLWHDLATFNGYLRRCQSVLQAGTPDSEVLLYFPFADVIHDGAETLPLFTIHNQDRWLHGTLYHRTAATLWERGITYDSASDAMLRDATVEDGRIVLGSNRFKVLVVPGARYVPDESMAHFVRLAEAGATVMFSPDVTPERIQAPGFHDHENRTRALREVFSRHFTATAADLADLLPTDGGVVAETMTGAGLRFVRRRHDDGYHYFIVNRGIEPFDGEITLAKPFQSVVVFDPWSDEAAGVAAAGPLRLRLAPSQSVILRTYDQRDVGGRRWQVRPAEGTSMALDRPWELRFVTGGPTLPAPASLPAPAFWSDFDAPDARSFSGTARYTTTFDYDGPQQALVAIDLGAVAHTARVFLNGELIGVAWCPPHRLERSAKLRQGRNELAVEVTNLAGNRIAHLDREGVQWKVFHEINFVNIDYKAFDAAAWPVLRSGLGGPVVLTLVPE